MLERYYKIANEIAERTVFSRTEVLGTIAFEIYCLVSKGYSKEEIEERMTIEHIEEALRLKALVGF